MFVKPVSFAHQSFDAVTFYGTFEVFFWYRDADLKRHFFWQIGFEIQKRQVFESKSSTFGKKAIE